MNKILITMLVLASLICSNAIQSKQVIIAFEGYINSLSQRTFDPLNGDVKLGATFTGTYTYDTDEVDTDPSDTRAVYHHNKNQSGFTLNIAGHNVVSNHAYVPLEYIINSQPSLSQLHLQSVNFDYLGYNTSVFISLIDDTGTALNTPDLVDTAPHLSDYNRNSFGFAFYNNLASYPPQESGVDMIHWGIVTKAYVVPSTPKTDIKSNLAGHWSFDESTGTVASDSSANGNNGVLTNGPLWTAGKIAGAIELDGIDDYVDVASDASLDDIDIKTITGWIKRKDIASSQFITLKGYTGGPGGWEFYVRRSTGGASANRIGYNHQWSGSRWRTAMWYGSTDLDIADQWYHVAIVYDATTDTNVPKIYLNGVQETITVENPALGYEASDAPNNLTIGGISGESANAMLDDVRIYRRALASTEIKQIYNLGILTFQCNDTIDNDNDGLIDFPADPGCSSAIDNDEFNTIVDITPPTIPTNLQAIVSSTISTSRVDLTWSPSTDDTGVIGYNIYRDGTKIGSSTSTIYTDSTVTQATTYNYSVTAFDAVGNQSSQSTAVNVTTTTPQCSDSLDNDGDGLIDFPSDPGCSSVTDDDEYNAPVDTMPPTLPTNLWTPIHYSAQVFIAWTASTDDTGVIGYGIYRDGTQIGSTTSTTYIDSAVTSATTYNYSVTAFDAVGNQSAQSVAINVTTLAAPQCSDSLDNDGNGLIDYPQDPGCYSATDDNEYYAPADTIPPTIPANLQATAISPSQIDLTWNASTDNGGWVSYKIYRDGIGIRGTSTLSYSDSSLTAGTTFTYSVTATDSRGNESLQSVSVNVATLWAPQCNDSLDNDGDGLIDFPNDPGCTSAIDDVEFNVPGATPPTTPANLCVTAIFSSQLDLLWSPSSDDVSVTGYNVYRDGIFVGTTTTPTYSDGSLTAGTTYSYTASAYDVSGNESPQSVALHLATLTVTMPNLIGHWTFDNATGTTTADSSASGNNGTMFNGAHLNNGALDLDGIDDYVDMYSDTSLDDIGIKTISAWIKRKDISSSQLIALKGYTGGPGGWEFNVRRSTGGASANRVGYNHQWSGSRWRTAMWYGSTDLDTVDLWYHLVLIYDAGSATNKPVMYVNGIQETVTVVNAAAGVEATDAPNKLTIGGVPGESSNAMIDDVRIYDKAMTTSEVQQLYNLGRPVAN